MEIIETDRLIIRGFTENDWLAVQEYTSDPDVMENVTTHIFTKSKAKEFVISNIGEHAESFAIILKSKNKLIGHILFRKWFFSSDTYDLGCVLSKNYHNKGYATEAGKEIIKYGFGKMKLHRIVASTISKNPLMKKHLERLGMRWEGCFKKCVRKGSEWNDLNLYAILDEEWRC